MKIKIRLIFTLGLIVAILPQIGITNEWKQYVYYIAGLGICVITYFSHKQLLFIGMKPGKSKSSSAPGSAVFVESLPKTQTTAVDSSSSNVEAR